MNASTIKNLKKVQKYVRKNYLYDNGPPDYKKLNPFDFVKISQLNDYTADDWKDHGAIEGDFLIDSSQSGEIVRIEHGEISKIFQN